MLLMGQLSISMAIFNSYVSLPGSFFGQFRWENRDQLEDSKKKLQLAMSADMWHQPTSQSSSRMG